MLIIRTDLPEPGDPYAQFQTPKIPVVPGNRYQVSAYCGAHRCTGEVIAEWFSATGVSLGSIGAYTVSLYGGGNRLDLYDHVYAFGTAPAGAAVVSVYIRKYDTKDGSETSYLFCHRPFFGEAEETQTVPTPWSDGPASVISSGLISDEAITSAKIGTGAVTTPALADLAVDLAKLGVQDAANLFSGGNMENYNLIPFTLDGTYWVRSSARAHTGTYSLKCNAGPGTHVAERITTVPVSPGDRYYVSFWAYIDASFNGSDGGSKLRFAIGSASGTYITAFSWSSIPVATWTEVTGIVTIPSTCNTLGIRLQSNNTAGTVWIDDMSVRKMVAAADLEDNAVTNAKIVNDAITAAKVATGAIGTTEIADDAITTPKLITGAVTADTIASSAVIAGKIATNAVTAGTVAANAITASKMLLRDNSNLISNPDFDDGELGWTGWNSETVLVTTSTGPAARLLHNTTYKTLYANDATYFPALPGESFYIEFYAYTNVASGSNMAVQMIGCNKSKTELTYGGLSTPITTSWAKYSNIYTFTNSDTRFCRIRMLTNNAGLGNYMYVNRIKVRKAASAELIVDGSITAGKIGADAVTANNIVAGTITATELAANSVSTSELVAGSVTSDIVASNAIIAGKIATNAISAGTIQSNAITSGKIAAGAIIASHVGANEIIANTANLKNGIVTNAKIGSAAITEAKIGSAAVTNAKIGSAAVTNAKIGSAAVSTLKVAGNAVTFPVFKTLTSNQSQGTWVPAGVLTGTTAWWEFMRFTVETQGENFVIFLKGNLYTSALATTFELRILVGGVTKYQGSVKELWDDSTDIMNLIDTTNSSDTVILQLRSGYSYIINTSGQWFTLYADAGTKAFCLGAKR